MPSADRFPWPLPFTKRQPATKRQPSPILKQEGQDPNLAVSLQFYSPGQPVWSPRNYDAFVREGYKKNGTVYLCINKISSAASGIRWRLYRAPDQRREVLNHPLLDLWKRPNPLQATGSFLEELFGFWHIAGNAYTWAYRAFPEGPPVALWHLRPDRVRIVAGERRVDSYVYGYNQPGSQVFPQEEVLHLKFAGYDDDLYGLSPLEVAAQLVDLQNEGQSWNVALLQNAGKPAAVLSTKQILTTEQRNQIREELRRKFSGKKNAGMPLVLEGDMSWQQMSLSPSELDWLSSREMGIREIAAIFDVAPELCGDSSGKTYANVAEARQALYQENVLPKLDRLRDHLNTWLVPMFPDLREMGAYFTYDCEDIEALQPLYQAARTATSDRANALWNSGQITLTQAQQMQGLTPDPQGNLYRIGDLLIPADALQDYARRCLSTLPSESQAIPTTDSPQISLPQQKGWPNDHTPRSPTFLPLVRPPLSPAPSPTPPTSPSALVETREAQEKEETPEKSRLPADPFRSQDETTPSLLYSRSAAPSEEATS